MFCRYISVLLSKKEKKIDIFSYICGFKKQTNKKLYLKKKKGSLLLFI